jgi:hypothetical protein
MMQPKPSEAWAFRSPTAPRGEMKWKYHLCIGCDAVFLFVSTHRHRRQDHRGVLIIPNSEVPCLPPTETGKSEISCTTIIKREFPDPKIPKKNRLCSVERRLMIDLIKFVQYSRQLTPDERDTILENLYDYYGADLA